MLQYNIVIAAYFVVDCFHLVINLQLYLWATHLRLYLLVFLPVMVSPWLPKQKLFQCTISLPQATQLISISLSTTFLCEPNRTSRGFTTHYGRRKITNVTYMTLFFVLHVLKLYLSTLSFGPNLVESSDVF